MILQKANAHADSFDASQRGPRCTSHPRRCTSFVHVEIRIPAGDARFHDRFPGQGSMVDWGPDDWGTDIDWTEMEQQGAKRHKAIDTRCPDASAAVQVLRLPWNSDKPPFPWSCDANKEPSLVHADELFSAQIVEPKQQGLQAAGVRMPLKAWHPNLALRQRFLIKPALVTVAPVAEQPPSTASGSVLGQFPNASQPSPASTSASVPFLEENIRAPCEGPPWQHASAGVQGERPPTGPSALPSSSHAASAAGRAGIQHFSREPAPKRVSPPALAVHGHIAAVAAACPEKRQAGQTPPNGNAGPRLSAQQARPAPRSSPAPVFDLTACDSYQPVHQHDGKLQSAANLTGAGAVTGQRLKQVGGMQLQGNEQQSASGSAVRLPVPLPGQAVAQQYSSSHQPAPSSCPRILATLPHQRPEHPLEPGARRQEHHAQAVLPRQAAQPIQQGLKPQSASAPSAATTPHGTGVFSNAKGNDSDDDDFMPSKLLADISKAASAPSTSALHHSSEPAAGPQG